MTVQDVLADAAVACKSFLGRFLAGFNDGNATAQAPHLPNHVLWSLGHVAFFLHAAAGKIDGRDFPPADFGPDGGSQRSRFATDAIGFGSHPEPTPAKYPQLARGIAIFEAACDRLAAAVRAADDATLARQVEWGGMSVALGTLALRVAMHVGTHTGQVMDLRRALGLEPVIRR